MPGRSTRTLISAVAVVATVIAVTPAFGGPGKFPKPDEKVGVEDNFFSARSATVSEGDTVRWTWRGNNRHNVAFKRVPKGASKRGATARRKGRWQRTFHEAGTYRYVCTFFTGMRGTITVAQPAAESNAGHPGESTPGG